MEKNQKGKQGKHTVWGVGLPVAIGEDIVDERVQ